MVFISTAEELASAEEPPTAGAALVQTENADTATTRGFLHRGTSVKTLADEMKSSSK